MGLSLLDRLCRLLATGLYLSYIPSQSTGSGSWRRWTQERRWTGAGLVGSLEGLALTPLLPGEPLRLGLFLVAATAAAVWLCGRAEKAFGVHDDPRIVLDEVVGYWTTVAFLPPRPAIWLAGLVLFRILDSVKPPPCGWLGRLPGGLGVVADDVGAGVLANAGLRVLVAFVPWFAQ